MIADGWTYSQWVVGNSRMRAVDPDWPAPGSTIHHTIGIWPVVAQRRDGGRECVPARRNWCCSPRARPFGARESRCGSSIPRTAAPHRDGRGAGRRAAQLGATPAGTRRGVPRNRECTWRLAAIAERRRRALSERARLRRRRRHRRRPQRAGGRGPAGRRRLGRRGARGPGRTRRRGEERRTRCPVTSATCSAPSIQCRWPRRRCAR